MNMYIRMNKAVTTLEVMVVVATIAILAAIAVPTFTAKIERTRGERAIANIEIIADAYRMYVVRNPIFTNFTLTSLTGLTPNINSTFNLELTDSNFTYNPVNVSTSSITLTATRNTSTAQTIVYTFTIATGVSIWAGTWPWLP